MPQSTFELNKRFKTLPLCTAVEVTYYYNRCPQPSARLYVASQQYFNCRESTEKYSLSLSLSLCVCVCFLLSLSLCVGVCVPF